ncbi:MAG: hypothetical protein ABSA93_38295 [Streptosporangiaceae bacterium]
MPSTTVTHLTPCRGGVGFISSSIATLSRALVFQIWTSSSPGASLGLSSAIDQPNATDSEK